MFCLITEPGVIVIALLVLLCCTWVHDRKNSSVLICGPGTEDFAADWQGFWHPTCPCCVALPTVVGVMLAGFCGGIAAPIFRFPGMGFAHF